MSRPSGLVWLLFPAVVGCGEIPASQQSPDAAIDGVTAAACDLSKPFGVPQQVAGLNSTAIEASVTFSPDELTAYFASNRGGDFDVYTATRASLSQAFSTATPIAAINEANKDEVGATINGDGKVLVFVRYDPTAKLFITTRSTDGTFAPATEIFELNAAASQDPRLAPDGLTLYYASSGTASLDLFVASRTTLSSTFAPVGGLSELNTADPEGSPFVTADGRRIVFTRYTANGNVWTATRGGATGAFDAPKVLSGADGYVQWLSSDGCRLYVVLPVAQNDHIFVQSRPQLP